MRIPATAAMLAGLLAMPATAVAPAAAAPSVPAISASGAAATSAAGALKRYDWKNATYTITLSDLVQIRLKNGKAPDVALQQVQHGTLGGKPSALVRITDALIDDTALHYALFQVVDGRVKQVGTGLSQRSYRSSTEAAVIRTRFGSSRLLETLPGVQTNSGRWDYDTVTSFVLKRPFLIPSKERFVCGHTGRC
ncbi:hypothetical protein [Motilibacter aurantiacus]|uniref:hypothetical protein n=1 Tax=Motilibacter aurantiacus TaxID=2714955 RepID=UPI00140C1E04|nr:hypothetical protein [Motilibacter aurantiacus]NHC45311.1 hypothetical protein [Motilibacter aurantiacus]